MRKFLLMCCVLIGFSAICRAQGGGGMRRSPEEQAKQLQTQLTLNDDQTAKITAIYKTQATKRDSIRTASNGDRDAMRQAMMPLMKSSDDQIKALLTPDQATAFQKIQDERRARMMNGGGGNR
jgi:periplasmic protein CpxP/Spy